MQVLAKKILARQTYNQSGRKVNSGANHTSNGVPSYEYASKLADKYFKESNEIPISPGMTAAVLEIGAASALVSCFPGPATKVNLATTIGELGGVLIARSKLSKKVKDGSLAWFQVGAGLFGFWGVLKETFFKKDDDMDFHEVALWKKVALSVSSVLCAFAMAAGAIEKSLLSMVSWNTPKNDKSEYRSSLTSAHGDRRCVAEWGLMAIVPWISNIGFIKKILDIAIPYQALKEGLDTFVEEPEATLFLGDKLPRSSWFKKILETIINPLSLLPGRQSAPEEKYKICWPFDKCIKFLIGTESDQNGKGKKGFRNYCLAPLFKTLQCKNVPNYYLDKKNNIVAEFADYRQSV